jgi:mono/diheme cytochrome c family protein
MTLPIRHLLLASAALGLVACTGAVPNVTQADTHWATQNWPDVTQAQLEQGRSLYVGHCGGCHAVVPPEKHSGDKWRAQIAEMAPRAKLEGPDRELVLRYLLTASRQTALERRAAAGTP